MCVYVCAYVDNRHVRICSGTQHHTARSQHTHHRTKSYWKKIRKRQKELLNSTWGTGSSRWTGGAGGSRGTVRTRCTSCTVATGRAGGPSSAVCARNTSCARGTRRTCFCFDTSMLFCCASTAAHHKCASPCMVGGENTSCGRSQIYLARPDYCKVLKMRRNRRDSTKNMFFWILCAPKMEHAQ